MNIEAKKFITKNILATGLYLLSFAQPSIATSEEFPDIVDFPPIPMKPIERPPLNPVVENTDEYFEDCLVISEETWTGVGSRYSEAGCVGCSDDLKMANGQKLNSNADTLAFWRLPLNSNVRVTNLKTDISRKARVTDRGGFDQAPGKLLPGLRERLFDLTTGLASRLGEFKTDVTPIEITLLRCN